MELERIHEGILQLRDRAPTRGASAVAEGHPREAGNARFAIANKLFEERDRKREALDELGALGARPGAPHLADHHGAELMQLVEPRLSQEPAAPSDARVVLAR